LGACVWADRVGRRVAVRHRLPAGGATDVVGRLVAVSDTELVVDGRAGPVRVPLVDVVAGKVVPPRPVRVAPPHRALAVADLEEVLALHWQPLEGERLGGWLLRASGGFTNRANSVLPLGDPGLPLIDALDAARAWYAARDLAARLSLPGPADGGPDPTDPFPGLRAAVAQAGWAVLPDAGALVLTAATAEQAGDRVHLPAPLRLALAGEPDAAWLAGYRYRGQDLPTYAIALLTSAPEQVFASVLDGEDTVAVARGSLAGGWAGLTAVEVADGYRRRGLARALLAAVAGWAAARRARSIYLQVSDANAGAQRLYLSAGFAVHHRYDYLQAGLQTRGP